MRNAYRRRPDDFKRRILERTDNKTDLLELEYKWLKQIDESELKTRYYNIYNHHFNHWTTNSYITETAKKRMSENHWTKRPDAAEIEARIDRNCSEETRRKISKSLKGKSLTYERSEETRRKISENNKRLQKEKRVGMHGKEHSEKTKKLMSENNAMNNPEHRAKVKASKQGIKHLRGQDGMRKMAVPGTEKFEMLISQGYTVI